jgi:L,D-transpeptidase ErfK/SrfK
MVRTGLNIAFVAILLIIAKLYCPKNNDVILYSQAMGSKALQYSSFERYSIVNRDITVENYFQYIDSIVKSYDSLTSYKLTEHLLVRANPWIIDNLKNTDYYIMKAKGLFVYNQKKMIVLSKGDTISIPDVKMANKIIDAFKNTRIDINVPEFKLRIFEDTIELYKFPVRVGRNEEKYLEMSGRIENLKTKTGEGFIVNHIRNPRYVNPVTNHEYFVTKRDDNKVTKLPQIPFIEAELNGIRYGQLIHPTTNHITLDKAYSNGCIGTKEADAWLIYYYAPISTKISVRYNLKISDGNGGEITLRDIYNYNKGD